MPKKLKRYPRPPDMKPENRAKFQALIDAGKRHKETTVIAGFKLKNVNQLFRWDTLEDVKL